MGWGLPEVLGEVFLDFLHVLEEGESSGMFLGPVGGIVLDSLVLEMIFLVHNC